jgi:hypothetical protein
MCQYLRILHAKEEILRCNVEVHYLQTAIAAEDEMFVHTLASLEALPIYAAIDAFCTHHHHINAHILSRITQALEGFTGDISCGIRVGGEVSPIINAAEVLQQNEDYDEGQDEDDDRNERDIGTLVDYILDMVLSCMVCSSYHDNMYMR